MESTRALPLTAVVTATQDQVSCELSGEVVVLSLRNGEYFGLNEVAASVWNLIQSPRTVQELRDRLLDEFAGITAERCEEELIRLLLELRDLELVSIG